MSGKEDKHKKRYKCGKSQVYLASQIEIVSL